jgi:beta-lactamase superfamily II metal-dependent hydrolase
MSAQAVVRMYNVGFGDAFLLILPGDDRPRRVLVDCGVLIGGAGPAPMKQVVGQIIADTTDPDGVARIDVVVGTHRHHDHVSGFADTRWADVWVGEVWMPWTEHPKDPLARQIRSTQSRTGLALTRALAAGTTPEDELAMILAENALSNAAAMRTLHTGFDGAPRRRYLPGAGGRRSFKPRGLPGVRVHVLGPSRDPEVIRDVDPPANKAWLRMAEAAQEQATPSSPFAGVRDIAPDRFERGRDSAHLALEPRDVRYLDGVAAADLFGVAVALDKAVNGTSLVLAFEVGEACLLFPGDAQWGTWLAIVEDEEAMELLARTSFWKIGHHGSHNATPKDFVAKLGALRDADEEPAELWSLVSTRHVEKWPEIPKEELLEAIEGLQGHLARSDREEPSSKVGFSRYEDTVIEATVPI